MTSSAAGPLWGVGRWDAADGSAMPWEISQAEIGRDMACAGRALGALGIGAGDRVLWCSMLSEAGQFWPYLVATMVAAAQLSCADATSAEASRLAMFCRLLDYRAVCGVTSALLDGLDALGVEYRDTFRRVGVLAARPGAYERLRDAGLSPYHFVLVGPAVAIGRSPGGPAALDAEEWRAEEDDGHIAVTSLRPRATAFRRARTAARGRVVDGAVVPEPRR